MEAVPFKASQPDNLENFRNMCEIINYLTNWSRTKSHPRRLKPAKTNELVNAEEFGNRFIPKILFCKFVTKTNYSNFFSLSKSVFFFFYNFWSQNQLLSIFLRKSFFLIFGDYCQFLTKNWLLVIFYRFWTKSSSAYIWKKLF